MSLVAEDQRAWHAGAGQWGGVDDVNSRSIGIEISNRGVTPFAAAQMDAVEELVSGIMQRWDIPAQGVIGHSDLAPGRKIDPGARFDWRRLALGGLAVWPDAGALKSATQHPDPGVFCADAVLFGYAPNLEPDLLLSTFRLRFRPWAKGPLDTFDMAMIGDLASRFPAELPRVQD
jgi:N-acetylmuramoyl-L-alanine amidase